MSTFNKQSMGVVSAGFGATMLPVPIVLQEKEMNIPMRPILDIVQSIMIHLIGLALILMSPKIALWVPIYFHGQ